MNGMNGGFNNMDSSSYGNSNNNVKGNFNGIGKSKITGSFLRERLIGKMDKLNEMERLNENKDKDVLVSGSKDTAVGDGKCNNEDDTNDSGDSLRKLKTKILLKRKLQKKVGGSQGSGDISFVKSKENMDLNLDGGVNDILTSAGLGNGGYHIKDIKGTGGYGGKGWIPSGRGRALTVEDIDSFAAYFKNELSQLTVGDFKNGKYVSKISELFNTFYKAIYDTDDDESYFEMMIDSEALISHRDRESLDFSKINQGGVTGLRSVLDGMDKLRRKFSIRNLPIRNVPNKNAGAEEDKEIVSKRKEAFRVIMNSLYENMDTLFGAPNVLLTIFNIGPISAYEGSGQSLNKFIDPAEKYFAYKGFSGFDWLAEGDKFGEEGGGGYDKGKYAFSRSLMYASKKFYSVYVSSEYFKKYFLNPLSDARKTGITHTLIELYYLSSLRFKESVDGRTEGKMSGDEVNKFVKEIVGKELFANTQLSVIETTGSVMKESGEDGGSTAMKYIKRHSLLELIMGSSRTSFERVAHVKRFFGEVGYEMLLAYMNSKHYLNEKGSSNADGNN